jgi:3-dehydroquinate dehydratase
MKIAVIQGPNLNMLGVRETNIYGPMKLEEIHAQMKQMVSSLIPQPIHTPQLRLPMHLQRLIYRLLKFISVISISVKSFVHTQ